SRVHSDANRVEHTCAVTLTTSGNYTHCPPALVIGVPVAFSEFSEIPVLNLVWVQPLLFGVHIFAHAPPAYSCSADSFPRKRVAAFSAFLTPLNQRAQNAKF